MRYAAKHNLGDYYIQFNCDNTLFPRALETISRHIDASPTIPIFIFPVYHWKLQMNLTGNPPLINQIDCFQLVAHKDVWKQENYWYRYETNSDGFIYEDMCKKYPRVHIKELLGDNY